MNKSYPSASTGRSVIRRCVRSSLSKVLLAAAILGSPLSYAQAPGGVSANLRIWLKPEVGFTPAQWSDQSGQNNNYTQTNVSRQPIALPSSDAYNFNPFVDFGTAGNDARFMAFPAGGPYTANGSNSTIFLTSILRNAGGYSDMLGFGGTTTGAGLINANYPVMTKLGTRMDIYPYAGPAIVTDLNRLSLNDVSFTVGTSGIKFGLNGNVSTVTSTFAAGYALHANGSILGSQPEVTNGAIGEVIAFERDLSEAEKVRVRSYLGIKYGLSLPHDYVAGDGTTTFWSTTTNTGYNNNIAGIARDNSSALYQKQAKSTEKGRQVLIGLDGLTSSNSSNNGTLSDGQFLVWGDNGLGKYPSIAISGIAGVNAHFAAIWKVQNTGSVSTVRIAWSKGLENLTLLQSTDDVFDGTDAATTMNGTTTINGITYSYADVSFTDGTYFTFAAYAHSPGGVLNSLTQWYRADGNINAPGGDSTDVISWTDFNFGVTSSKINTAPLPIYKEGSTNYLNFNPGVKFTAIQQMIGNISEPTLQSVNFDIFSMTKEGMSGTRFFNIGMNNTTFNGANWDQPALYANGAIIRRSNTGGINYWANPGNVMYDGGIPSIMYNTFTNTTVSKGLNGAPNGAIASHSAIGAVSGGHIFGANGGTNPPGGDDWGFTGDIGELIIYGAGNITPAERNKVDAYLAIKYGITLDTSNNYVNSNDIIVWDTAVNAGYYNNVAGIANDKPSALHQNQSISVNAGQQVIISTTGLANTNASNTVTLNEGQFLMWGDNGLAKVPSISISGLIDVNFRFASVWKVQNTSSVGTVRVAWPSGLVNLSLVQSTDPTFATGNTKTGMTANTTTVNGVIYNYADVSFTDGQYFTFAAQLNGPGGVGADLRVWLRSDAGFSPSSWSDFSGNDNNYTQTNVTRQPFVDTILHNFNPAIDFGTSASADGRFMVVPSGKPFTSNGLSGTFFTATLTRTGGTSGYRDIWGFGGTTTTANLKEADIPSITKLNNNIVLYSSTTSAFPGLYPDNKLLLSDVSYTVGVSGINYGLNGKVASTTQTRVAGNSLQANGSILGSQPQVMNGLIGEAIAYERDLTEAEKMRVRSYIAIKYGITLIHNYIASNGSTVYWDTTTNTGYNNNIAGIVRDDYGSLYQKQSNSINTGRQVLISTTNLDNSNAANTGTLTDQQFLVWGDNGLAKAPTVPIAGISGVNNRFASIWKVENTGSVGTVRVAWPIGYANLKLIQSTDVNFTSTDVVTNMTATQMVGGKEYAYVDVPFTDGQYFTFAAFVQAPGGVTNGLSHWYRADKSVDAAGVGADVTSWTDFTSGVVSSEINGAPLPKLKEGDSAYFNYNPGINFTAIQQMIGNINVQTLNSLNFDIFSLTKEGMSGTRYFNIGMDNTTFNGSNWDQPGFYTNGAIARRNNTGGLPYLGTPGSITFSPNSPSIMYNTFTDATLSKGLNGASNGTTATHAPIGIVTGGHIFGANTGINPPGGDDWGFTGSIGELIIYGNGTITAAERNKVDAYLAIKYGVTLNSSNNYTTSQDIVVWDAAANSGYYNNVAGVGNDFLSALDQKQSRSQMANTNNQVIIGLGEIAETNATNPNELTDGQFMLWGDNGNTQNIGVASTAFVYAGSIYNGKRMNRVWKVQNTGVLQTMKVRFPIASLGTTTLTDESCAQYVLLSSDDSTFTTNVAVATLTVNGTDYDAEHRFQNGVSYFTYARVRPISLGTAYLPVLTDTTTEYGACPSGDWTYFNETGNPANKLIAISGLTITQLNGITATITTDGANYDNGTRKTVLMPRITTIVDTTNSTLSGVNVRVYYSDNEMTATQLPGAVTNSWFRYEGDADDVKTDIYTFGVFEAGKAIAMTPDVIGIEDSVNYVEFHNIDSFPSFVYLSSTDAIGAVLPITILYFDAEKKGNTAMLSWATASEKNNAGFDIERSTDARTWNSLSFVNSIAEEGNSNNKLAYTYIDESPLKGSNYYRLKQTDLDGRYKYSVIRQLTFDGNNSEISIHPNPTQDFVIIDGLSGDESIKVYDATGRIVKELKPNQTSATIHLNELSEGLYHINIISANGNTVSKKVVKVK